MTFKAAKRYLNLPNGNSGIFCNFEAINIELTTTFKKIYRAVDFLADIQIFYRTVEIFTVSEEILTVG